MNIIMTSVSQSIIIIMIIGIFYIIQKLYISLEQFDFHFVRYWNVIYQYSINAIYYLIIGLRYLKSV